MMIPNDYSTNQTSWTKLYKSLIQLLDPSFPSFFDSYTPN